MTPLYRLQGTTGGGGGVERGEGPYHQLADAPLPVSSHNCKNNSVLWVKREAVLPPPPGYLPLTHPTCLPSLPSLYTLHPPKSYNLPDQESKRKIRIEEDPIYQEISEKSTYYSVIKGANEDNATDNQNFDTSDKGIESVTRNLEAGKSEIIYGMITAKQVAKFVPCTQSSILRP